MSALQINLPIPKASQDNLGHAIFKLIQLSKIVDSAPVSIVQLDFSNTRFQYSCFLAGLHLLIRQWRAIGKIVTFTNIDSDPFYNYLCAIKFFDGCNGETDSDLDVYKSKTYTPVFRFSTEPKFRERCVNVAIDVIFGQTNMTGLSSSDFKNVIDYFISELTNNIADHSKSSHGIVFTQVYPQKGFMDVTIGDNGVGILSSYSSSTKFQPNNEKEAIEMAIQGCSTKDLAESRGYGLSQSRNLLVKGLSGIFCMWTGRHLFVDGGKANSVTVRIEEGANLNGCYLNLRLPLSSTLVGDFYDYMS